MNYHFCKRLTAVAIALVLAWPASAQSLFTDVPDDHWAKDAVARLADRGLVETYPDGTFKGDRIASRLFVARIMALMLAGVEQAIADTNNPAALRGLRQIGGALNANLGRLGANMPASTISYGDPDIAPQIYQSETDELLWSVQRRAQAFGTFDELDAATRYDAAAFFTPAATEYGDYMKSIQRDIDRPRKLRFPELEPIVAFNDGQGDESVPRVTLAGMAARVSIEIEAAQALVSGSQDVATTGRDVGVLPRRGRIPASQGEPGASKRFSGVFGQTGYQFAHLPDRELGIRNLGIDFNPLHTMSVDLDGPYFSGGFFLPVDLPERFGRGWTMTVTGTLAQLQGSDSDAIAGFNQGQLPTYIDLSGTGGLTFNDTSRVTMNSDYDVYKIEAELSRAIAEANALISAGVFFQHTRLQNNITLDSDFQNGTFFNTVDDRITQNMVGATAGMEFLLNPAEAWLLVFGGYFGLAQVWGEYRGSDCGDASLATPGCDGVLFSNSGIGANNSGLGFVGGLKAALAFYSFCRDNPAAVTAALIQSAVDTLKENCVEVSFGGSVDTYPGQEVNQPTAIGGGSVALGLAQTVVGSVFAGIRKSF